MDPALAAPWPPPRDSLAEACGLAAARRRPVLLSIARRLADLPDPLPLVAAARRAGRATALLERTDEAIAGLGVAWSHAANGAHRFATARDAAAALFAEAVVDGDVAPLAIAAFAFAPAAPGGDWQGFPAARVLVPRLALLRRGGVATRIVTLLVEPGDAPDAVAFRLRRTLARLDEWRARPAAAAHHPCYRARPAPHPAAWQRAVAATVADIGRGHFSKLVLARTCRLDADEPFPCAAAAARLRRAYPSCTTFWLGGAGGDFLGATPELLARVDGRAVSTAALAGTAPRATTAAADDALARALLASDKDRREHAIVVDGIRAALQPLCETLAIDPVPQVVRLANAHHLRSAIAGRLTAPAHALDVVDRLHPTPAVAGQPRAAALAALPAREGLERGWYAGPLGWFDAAGDGAFDVALRCALIRGRRALLFAGAGIVAGSDPEAELDETRLKLQPLLAALMEV
ncbi:isochorismate synthase [bacterium]|nr:isochorismate synthase [bacterium]